MSTEGLYGSSTAANLPRVCVAECIGTFMLVLAGTAVAVQAALDLPIAGNSADSLAVALAFGLVLIALVCALGHISGSHFNPAVTLALALTGHFPWKYVVPYIVAQLGGAVLASLAVLRMYGDTAKTIAALGATQPATGIDGRDVFLIEAIVTFMLMFVIMAVATDDRVPATVAGIAVGFTLSVCILVAGPLTGGAINPTRALGPMLVSGKMEMWYLYVLGPVMGSISAALLYDKFLREATEPSEAEDV